LRNNSLKKESEMMRKWQLIINQKHKDFSERNRKKGGKND